MTLKEFTTIKTCLRVHKDDKEVISAISTLMTQLYGEQVKTHIINYCLNKESPFEIDEEVVEVMNDPLAYYISGDPAPLSQLKTTFKNNVIVQGLCDALKTKF